MTLSFSVAALGALIVAVRILPVDTALTEGAGQHHVTDVVGTTVFIACFPVPT